MKKFILLAIIIVLLLGITYFNYQAMTEEKQVAVEEFNQQLEQPIPDFTPPGEIAVDELEEERSETEIQSPFKVEDEITEAVETTDEIEEDEITEAEIGPGEDDEEDEEDESTEEEADEEDSEVDLSEETKDNIDLKAIVRYLDINFARLEVNGEIDNFSVGDEINGLLLEEIARDKVILTKEDDEFVAEMYD